MKFKLRKWQIDAGQLAIERFKAGHKVFVTEACTGAGKTLHGCDVMHRLSRDGMAELVVVVTPSTATRIGWVERLNEVGFNATDNPDLFGTADFDAAVITYSAIAALDKALKGRPIYNGIAAVVDEYHHGEQDASWGATISRIEQISQSVLFLSGTPWRSNGQIAVLASHCNMRGEPYYDGDRVKADYAYTYRDDLEQQGDDRGTVAVRFFFHDSQCTDKAGRTEKLTNPHLDKMSHEAREAWIEEAMKSDIRIGKHVRTQGTIANYSLNGNALVKSMLADGIASLQSYRERMGGSPLPVLLVVAQNIKEAHALHQSMQNGMAVYGRPVRSALIVSDKDTASHEISEVQAKCRSGLLDVIVSVGMVSEGVDIPQIKGVVFLSAIMTALYIVQVIGRLLRRIRVNDAYMDTSVNHAPGFFIAPAAPKLRAIAARIEQEISEAAASARSEKTDGTEVSTRPEPDDPCFVETTGDIERVYRGSEDHAKLQEAVEAMINHERARDCHVDRFWAEWVLSMALSGETAAWKEARRQMEDRCQCLGIELADLFQDAMRVAGLNLTMEQKHKIASREAEIARQRVRHEVLPYRNMEDNGVAYKEVALAIRHRCMFGRSWSFTTATLDEKHRWIDEANAMRREVA
jgi:superfamily II DNA or RNA helicase